MARLFPLRTDTPSREGQPRVVDLEDEDADAVFSALSSTTARRIYTTLSDEPGTPSDVAEAIDSSIQNVRYHLEKLEAAGLVEVVDTWYSSRGNEMSVYATASGPLIVTSDESKATQLKAALSRFIGGVGALAGASLLVQYGLERFFTPGTESASPYLAGDEAEIADDEPDTETTDDEAADTAADDSDDESSDVDTAADDDADEEDDFGATTADEEEDEAPEEDAAAEDDADDDAADGDDVADGDDAAGDDPVEFSSEAPPDDTYTTTEGAPEAAEAVFSTIPPGALFFLGGLVVLIAVTAYWYWSAHRI